MTIHLITEPEYSQSTWYTSIEKSIIEHAMHKRVKIKSETSDFSAQPDDAIVIIGSRSDWIYNAVNKAKFTQSAPVILISSKPYDLAVNNICTDLYSAMQDVISYLKKCKKTKTALFGINPVSQTDNVRLNSFKNKKDVYRSYGDLMSCCCDFLENIDKYDSVICANDFAAISLLNYLKKHDPTAIDKLYIVGFGDFRIARLYNPAITSVSQNYNDYGMALLELLPFILKNKNIGHISLNIKSKIIVRETTGNTSFTPNESLPEKKTKSNTDFYNDYEIKMLLKIEKFLNYSDEKDISIIKSLLDGNSYEKTAELHYFSVNGIKYRLKRICDTCGIESVKELLSLINESNLSDNPANLLI